MTPIAWPTLDLLTVEVPVVLFTDWSREPSLTKGLQTKQFYL